MNSLIKIKNIDFFHAIDNRFSTFIGEYTGHGMAFKQVGDLVYGNILNPTGLIPAVYYKTGLLQGTIEDGSGFFTWNNLFLSGNGEAGKIYSEYITGEISSSNVIEFLDLTGSGLINGDILEIQGFQFIFSDNPESFSEFDSPATLINILNSGATGGFNNLGIFEIESIGITGFQESNKLNLFSYLRKGEDGNVITISRFTQNLDAIKIYNRYFTGGQTLRRPFNNFTGVFSNTFNEITVLKSGIYQETNNQQFFTNVSGVSWEDNFKNYILLTGLVNNENPDLYSGVQINFNQINSRYIGSGLIPSGQKSPFTGVKIEIIKSNPYDISGNLFKYTFKVDNFIFTGILEG